MDADGAALAERAKGSRACGGDGHGDRISGQENVFDAHRL